MLLLQKKIILYKQILLNQKIYSNIKLRLFKMILKTLRKEIIESFNIGVKLPKMSEDKIKEEDLVGPQKGN